MQKKAYLYLPNNSKDRDIEQFLVKAYENNSQDLEIICHSETDDYQKPVLNAIVSELQPDDAVYVYCISDTAKNQEGMLNFLATLRTCKARFFSMEQRIRVTDSINALYQHYYNAFQSASKMRSRTTKEGLKKAKENGSFGGRPKVLSDKLFVKVFKDVTGGSTVENACAKHGLSKASYYRMMKQMDMSEIMGSMK